MWTSITVMTAISAIVGLATLAGFTAALYVKALCKSPLALSCGNMPG